MKYIRIFSFVLFLQLCSLASAQTFSAGAGLSLGVPAEDAVGYGVGVDISYDQTIVDFGSWKLSAVPEMIAGNYRIGVTGGFANDVFADFWLPALFRFAPDGDKRYFSPVAGPYAELVFDSLGLCKHFDSVAAKASVITPVPGGVGPMTICCLMENTIKCFLAKM